MIYCLFHLRNITTRNSFWSVISRANSFIAVVQHTRPKLLIKHKIFCTRCCYHYEVAFIFSYDTLVSLDKVSFKLALSIENVLKNNNIYGHTIIIRQKHLFNLKLKINLNTIITYLTYIRVQIVLRQTSFNSIYSSS